MIEIRISRTQLPMPVFSSTAAGNGPVAAEKNTDQIGSQP